MYIHKIYHCLAILFQANISRDLPIYFSKSFELVKFESLWKTHFKSSRHLKNEVFMTIFFRASTPRKKKNIRKKKNVQILYG